jgi:transcription initiation factor TFIIE subunit alpha
MNLSKKVIEDTVEKTTGKEVIPLVNVLRNKKNVSEFQLADNLKKDINETRHMLYRLYNNNLVSSTKKKDRKKGWYVYYWSLNLKRMKYLATKSRERQIKSLKNRLEKEKHTNFYYCSNNCTRLEFETATEMDFRCPECGNLLLQKDNKDIIEKLDKKIKELKI